TNGSWTAMARSGG
ncbi:hypothetical protein EE612_034581, partial [Oryza sativa]